MEKKSLWTDIYHFGVRAAIHERLERKCVKAVFESRKTGKLPKLWLWSRLEKLLRPKTATIVVPSNLSKKEIK